MFQLFKKFFGQKKNNKPDRYYDDLENMPFPDRIKLLVNGNRCDKTQARLEVYKENTRLFLDWKDGNSEIELGNYQEFLDGAKLYSQFFSVNGKGVRYECTQTGCVNADCVDVAEQLLAKGYDPAILNLASAKHPGGGYHYGTSAQEESLCRSSNLVLSLYQFADPQVMPCVEESCVPVKQTGYPLDINFGGIYTPKVTFFRNGMSKLFSLRENRFQCDVITVAALSFTGRPDYSGQYETRFQSETGGFTEEGEKIMLNKIRTIFRLGVEHGKDALVLGAFGCGAYQLPIPEVVRLFQTVISEPEFTNKFKVLVFAILEGEKKYVEENGKFADFYSAFGKYPTV